MRALTVIGLALATAIASGSALWCPTIQVALVRAKRLQKPILVGGMGWRRGSSYLQDSSYDSVLSDFIPVEVGSYDELRGACRALPAQGMPSLVILDSNGRLLKRLAGLNRSTDLEAANQQVKWMLREGDKVFRAATTPKAPGNANADAATILAMQGNLSAARAQLAIAKRKGASPWRLAAALESLGDEARVQGDPRSTVVYYQSALAYRPVASTEVRIRLRLASSMLWSGNMNGALAQANAVANHPTSLPSDIEYAKRIVVRIQSADPNGFRTPTRGPVIVPK